MIFGSAVVYIYKFTNRKEKKEASEKEEGKKGREERKELSGVENCREKSLIGDH